MSGLELSPNTIFFSYDTREQKENLIGRFNEEFQKLLMFGTREEKKKQEIKLGHICAVFLFVN